MVEFATSIENLIESQDREYLLRTTSKDHAKELSQQRSKVINDALQSLCVNECNFRSSPTGEEILKILEDFFLTDQIEADDCIHSKRSKRRILSDLTTLSMRSLSPSNSLRKALSLSTSKKKRPLDDCSRVSIQLPHLESKTKNANEITLQNQHFSNESGIMHDFQDRTITSESVNSILIGVALLIAILALRAASTITVTMTISLDTGFIFCFSLYCIGLHTSSFLSTYSPKKKGVEKARKSVTRSSNLIHRPSLLVRRTPSYQKLDDDVDEAIEEDNILKSPLAMFPRGASLGDHLNCWSIPDSTSFKVRGPGYLKDKKKIPSGPFLLPVRGMDLMLTDAAPENIGQNTAILGGALREKPTFVMNFRLPWGVVILYFEIPEKFVPFVRSRYEFEYQNEMDFSGMLKSMSPAEKCMAKFLQANEATKNKVLKIVPVVVQGPWVVRGVVNGKPAIVGKALPVTYLYERAENGKALYLEADMDVVSSAAARNILSVVRNHTQSLTLDLGFVVQGNSEEELPEQMLGAVRLHGIDIYSCSPLPPMNHDLRLISSDSNDSSDTFS